MRIDRRWWLAIAVAVVAVVALVLGRTVFGHSSKECAPVRDLLAFNSEQGRLIASKHGADDPAIPTVAEETAYQAWADGLAERAQKVTQPELTNGAVHLADLASQFVAKLPQVRAEASARAPGAPAPPVVFEMSALNDQIVQQTNELSKACPD